MLPPARTVLHPRIWLGLAIQTFKTSDSKTAKSQLAGDKQVCKGPGKNRAQWDTQLLLFVTSPFLTISIKPLSSKERKYCFWKESISCQFVKQSSWNYQGILIYKVDLFSKVVPLKWTNSSYKKNASFLFHILPSSKLSQDLLPEDSPISLGLREAINSYLLVTEDLPSEDRSTKKRKKCKDSWSPLETCGPTELEGKAEDSPWFIICY